MRKSLNINKFVAIFFIEAPGEGFWKLLRENKIQLFILCIWYFQFTNKGRDTVGTQYTVTRLIRDYATEQQISCVSAYFTHTVKAKTQLFSKLCVSRTLDIFLIRNCEYLPSASISCLQSKRCIYKNVLAGKSKTQSNDR